MYNKRQLAKNEKSGKHPRKLKKLKKGGVITDPNGQWAHPGEITRIPSGDITMQGVPYPVFGVDNLGNSQMMQPGGDYSFPGSSVTEYPQMQDGGAQPAGMENGGWLNMYKEGGDSDPPKTVDIEKKSIPRKVAVFAESIPQEVPTYSIFQTQNLPKSLQDISREYKKQEEASRNMYEEYLMNVEQYESSNQELRDYIYKNIKSLDLDDRFESAGPGLYAHLTNKITEVAYDKKDWTTAAKLLQTSLRDEGFENLAGNVELLKRIYNTYNAVNKGNQLHFAESELDLKKDDIRETFYNSPDNPKTTKKNNSPFLEESENIKKYYAKKDPNTQVDVYPIGDISDTSIVNKAMTGNPNDVVIMGHHGEKYGRIPAKWWGNKLSKTKQENCYLGSCYSQDMADGPMQNIRNFHYRPNDPWYGVNPNATGDFKDAMYSRTTEEPGSMPIVRTPRLGIDYKIKKEFGGWLDTLEEGGMIRPRMSSPPVPIKGYVPKAQNGLNFTGAKTGEDSAYATSSFNWYMNPNTNDKAAFDLMQLATFIKDPRSKDLVTPDTWNKAFIRYNALLDASNTPVIKKSKGGPWLDIYQDKEEYQMTGPYRKPSIVKGKPSIPPAVAESTYVQPRHIAIPVPPKNKPPLENNIFYSSLSKPSLEVNEEEDNSYYNRMWKEVRKNDNYDIVTNKNKIVIDDRPKIKLTQGRYNLAKVEPAIIDSALAVSKRYGIDPYDMLSVIGRESTFGAVLQEKESSATNHRKNQVRQRESQNATELTSNWENADRDINDKNPLKFLANRKNPYVTVDKNRKGWSYYTSDDNAKKLAETVDKSTYDNYVDYLKKYNSNYKYLSAFEDLAQKIKTGKMGKYNPGDPDYQNKLAKEKELLLADNALTKYISSKEYGGSNNWLDEYQDKGEYKWDPSTMKTTPQVPLPTVGTQTRTVTPPQEYKRATTQYKLDQEAILEAEEAKHLAKLEEREKYVTLQTKHDYNPIYGKYRNSLSSKLYDQDNLVGGRMDALANKERIDQLTKLGVLGTVGVAGAAALPVLAPAVSSAINAGFVGYGLTELPNTYRTVRDPNISNWDKAQEVGWNALDFAGTGAARKWIAPGMKQLLNKNIRPFIPAPSTGIVNPLAQFTPNKTIWGQAWDGPWLTHFANRRAQDQEVKKRDGGSTWLDQYQDGKQFSPLVYRNAPRSVPPPAVPAPPIVSPTIPQEYLWANATPSPSASLRGTPAVVPPKPLVVPPQSQPSGYEYAWQQGPGSTVQETPKKLPISKPAASTTVLPQSQEQPSGYEYAWEKGTTSSGPKSKEKPKEEEPDFIEKLEMYVKSDVPIEETAKILAKSKGYDLEEDEVVTTKPFNINERVKRGRSFNDLGVGTYSEQDIDMSDGIVVKYQPRNEKAANRTDVDNAVAITDYLYDQDFTDNYAHGDAQNSLSRLKSQFEKKDFGDRKFVTVREPKGDDKYIVRVKKTSDLTDQDFKDNRIYRQGYAKLSDFDITPDGKKIKLKQYKNMFVNQGIPYRNESNPENGLRVPGGKGNYGKYQDIDSLNQFGAYLGGAVTIISEDGKISRKISGSLKNIIQVAQEIKNKTKGEVYFLQSDAGSMNIKADAKDGKLTTKQMKIARNQENWAGASEIMLNESPYQTNQEPVEEEVPGRGVGSPQPVQTKKAKPTYKVGANTVHNKQVKTWLDNQPQHIKDQIAQLPPLVSKRQGGSWLNQYNP